MKIHTVEFDARFIRPGDPRVYILTSAQSVLKAWQDNKPPTHRDSTRRAPGCEASMEERIGHVLRSMNMVLYGLDAPMSGPQIERVLDIHNVVTDAISIRDRWVELCVDMVRAMGVDAILSRGINAPADAPQYVYELDTPQFRAVYEPRK